MEYGVPGAAKNTGADARVFPSPFGRGKEDNSANGPSASALSANGLVNPLAGFSLWPPS